MAAPALRPRIPHAGSLADETAFLVGMSWLAPEPLVASAKKFRANAAGGQNVSRFKPVAVDRIDDRYPLAFGQGGELAVAWVETGVDDRLRKIGVFAVAAFRKVDALA